MSNREERSMSEVLLEFAGHFAPDAGVKDLAEDEGATNRIVLTALAAWNTALHPAGEREERLGLCLSSFPREVAEALKPLARRMIAHKDERYGDDLRAVRRCVLSFGTRGPKLRVVLAKAAGQKR